MTSARSDRSQTEVNQISQRGARFWMLVPVILLGVSVSGWLWMVSMAVNDPGFSVETDYYKKGAHYDDEMARRASNQRLGWQVSEADTQSEADQSGRITVVISDGFGRQIDELNLRAEAFPVARGADVRQITFVPLGAGRYEAHLDRVRLGLWTVRLLAQQAEISFTHELRVEFYPAVEPPS
jgi:hypothetical protein